MGLRLSLLKTINLYLYMVVKQQINFMYLNQKRESFKKIWKRLLNQLNIIRSQMNITFQQFIKRRRI
ncbi:unnamed protein product [Paramecium pentaurelia]|uniref:Uncharacterized protein n=1 Tax=Paramecium pentaurelia TaxID=43138 RepID=A0A8S1VZ73_9CILI|nr:unnamed protein product [Paramecium pentaurelia]